ncbi:flagellar assembly peptidoglycan hydrolase FlgJ [Pseudorhodoplanes sinuspersici]|nr:flagellar assembly peptidoglycan hydrolase FlgJ [Pseudorhodoplanes sinuspersici]RKE72409.1 rod binding protein [Pseudorhodoplanes sinuspersici]
MASSIDMSAASSVKSAYALLSAQKESGAANNLGGVNEKAMNAAQDFEAVFLNSMFSQMFTSIDGEGPFGGDQSTGVWRSFLTDEYARSFAKKGGVGIASDVYRTLMWQQDVNNTAQPMPMENKS